MGRWSLTDRQGQSPDDAGVLVGMSGGVDSSAAALILREQGHRVVGVTLRLLGDLAGHGDRTCCSSEAVQRAKAVCRRIGIPHYVIDAEAAFRHDVVDYFVDEYAQGRTPNPCVRCNARVRFAAMLAFAKGLGLGRVATGHYARLTGDPVGLARGVDRKKDQSYVLAQVDPQVLGQCVFPLGEMTKAEVRELAARAGLEGHHAPESQEICFVPDDDYRRFLRERLGERPGAIVDLHGLEVGRHAGTYNFTVGQRKGLGITAEEPLYVAGIEAERREVAVGSLADLAVGRMEIDNIVRHRQGLPEGVSVQWRSTGGAVRVRVAGGVIVLDEPALGVSPGQTAVVYDGDAVVMAGTVTTAARR